MSIPDAPDFQDYTVWNTGNLLPGYNQNWNPGDNFTARYLIDSFGALAINCKSFFGQIVFTALVFPDSVTNNPIMTFPWPINVNTQLVCSFPIVGGYVQFNAHNPLGSGAVGGLYVAGANNGVSAVSYLCPGNLVNPGTISYAAGTRTNYPFPFISNGPAHIHFDTAAAGSVFNIDVATTLDGVTPLNTVFHGVVTSQFDADVTLPDVPLLVGVTNTDAAAHNGRLAAFQAA